VKYTKKLREDFTWAVVDEDDYEIFFGLTEEAAEALLSKLQ